MEGKTMVVKKTQEKPSEIDILRVNLGEAKLWIKGTSPLIYNCMSEKARHELLFPSGKKTAADRATKLKHEPMEEYRNSVYRRVGEDGPTRLIFPAAAFKGAMAEAALEIPGAKKTQIQRLVWVKGDYVDVYGVPEMLMSVVRMQDMSHTPDIRTRAILRNWACCIDVRFSTPTLNTKNIGNLAFAGGMFIGVGDFRQGKGRGSYGQFEPANPEDVADIIKNGGIKEQDAALMKPDYYDVETRSLYEWFENERKVRGK